MKENLNNILLNLDLLIKDNNYKYNEFDLNEVRSIVNNFIKFFEDSKDVSLLEFDKIKILSDIVYDLNCKNNFAEITDNISNELYAFKFLLQGYLGNKEL